MADSGGAITTLTNVEGTVKWFDPKKGFGFVVGPQGQDIFVHFSKIEGEGFRALKDGSKVMYDAHKTDKGWHALRVVRIAAEGEVAGAIEDEARSNPRSPRR